MKPSAAAARALLRALVAVAAVLGTAVASAPASAQVAPAIDRTDDEAVEVSARTDRAQDRLRLKLGESALIDNDQATGTPRIIARLDGFLTAPSDDDAESVALDYVRDHLGAFGLTGDDLASLRLTSRRRDAAGTVHLAWAQSAGGLPSVDGGLEAAVTEEGRLLNVRGGVVPDLPRELPEPLVSAPTAYATALPGDAPAPRSAGAQGVSRAREFADGGSASLVRYQDGGADRLGWRLLLPASSEEFYDAVVDARTGALQRRINRVRFAVNHFEVNPRAEGGSPVEDDPMPTDWLPAGATTLSGKYAHAVSDLDDSIKLLDDEPPFPISEPVLADEVLSTAPGEWLFDPALGSSAGFCEPLCSWRGSNRAANRDFSTAQLFWYVNTFRRHLAEDPMIGFNADAGGFEDEDPVLAQSLDGASTEDPDPDLSVPDIDHRSNASMLTLPDGVRGLMQIHLYAPGSRRYDGAHDAALVYHEYAHGLTDRLVTDADGWAAMFGRQPDALAEGISDFYAMDFLVETQPGLVPDDPDEPGEVHFGKWLQFSSSTKGRDGTLRTEGLDCRVGEPDTDACPGTEGTLAGGYRYGDFGDVEDGPEAHADGEIWAQTLWDLRTTLGVEHTREYVTDGLSLAPDQPTFLDMRNAIVQAAVSARGNEDWAAIWEVFANRGMGWSAATEGPHDVTPSPAADEPPEPGDMSNRGDVAGIVTDQAGQPLSDARVAVAGHDSDVGSADLTAITGTDGRYLLSAVPDGPYPDIYVHKPGYQERAAGLTVPEGDGTTTVDFRGLRRDYASTVWGGSAHSEANFDDCGAAQAVDDDKKTVWSAPAGAGPQDLIIDLGQQIDVADVRIDPRPGCDDGPEASLSQYELHASSGFGQAFQHLAAGTLGSPDARGYVSVGLDTSALAGRRYLRLRALTPRSMNQGEGPAFMDVSEIEVTGTPSPPPPDPNPPSVPSPPANPPPPNPPSNPPATVRPTLLLDTKLRAKRKGTFKVRAFFGDAAPAGSARFTVIGGSKRTRYARATTPVRVGGNVTKTLKLTRKGRKAIKPGKSKKVTLELRLPNGQKLKKTLRLARAKR